MSNDLVQDTVPVAYIDRRQLLRSRLTEEAFRSQQQALQDTSTTLYVGNLSYHTREAQIWMHFSPYGHIREVVVGLSEGDSTSSAIIGGASSDAMRRAPHGASSSSTALAVHSSDLKSPCGFCFVVFERRMAAVAAQQALHRSLLDDRVISVSWDTGLAPAARSCSTADPLEEAMSRRWGRGAYGGQVVDHLRPNHDDARGGLGALRRAALGLVGPSAGQSTSSGPGKFLALLRHIATSNPDLYRLYFNQLNSVEGEDDGMHWYWTEGDPRRRRLAAKRSRSGQPKGGRPG